MFERVLSKNVKELLDLLDQSNLLKYSYLAGDTALVLQIDHRYSCDFDFFTLKKLNENEFIKKLSELFPDFVLEKKEL